MRKVMLAVGLAAMLVVPSAAFADAAADYAKSCKICHGADGKGKFPFSFTKTDAEMADAIAKGTTSQDGKVKMKAYKDADAKALVEYIKTLKK